MSTTSSSAFSRNALDEKTNLQTAQQLQKRLIDLVDLTLMLKQAHRNVLGTNFPSVHLQLDEIIESVRNASDEFAERISSLGIPADGRSQTVSQDTELKTYPAGFQKTDETLTLVANALMQTVEGLKHSMKELADFDPVSEDMCIATCAVLEKHLWMVQAQEK